MASNVPGLKVPTARTWVTALLVIGALVLAAMLVWQGVSAQGSPDPLSPGNSSGTAAVDIAVLVFREGLECILVLTAITAGLMGSTQSYRRPIGIGVLLGVAATIATWLIAVTILDDLLESVSALSLQAATGLLAIVVLLVVMNWFFHKVYWTGWISFHNRRKRDLIEDAKNPGASQARLFWGLVLLGLTSFYREGFEVVLFLQSYRLRLGDGIVMYGALLGLIFCGIVAVLNFVGHHRLPYKKMLVVTGVMLAAVLFIMVGEEVNEMQLAGWIGTSTIPWLEGLPSWAGTWFAVFPNWETIVAQLVALLVVLGSYFVSQYQAVLLPKRRGLSPYARRESPPATDTV
jgi:high-affinity iron transporter